MVTATPTTSSGMGSSRPVTPIQHGQDNVATSNGNDVSVTANYLQDQEKQETENKVEGS
jgi:hypothetical protein